MLASRSLPFAVALSILLAACQDSAEPNPAVGKPVDESGAKTEASKRSPAASPWSGKVVETMNSGGYTYVLMDTGAEQKWVAGPQVEGLTVGQSISVAQPMEMRDFSSGTLKRTFPVIYFVGVIHGGKPVAAKGSSAGKEPAKGPPAEKPEAKKAAPVAKVEGGYSVAEIFAQRKELAGKAVKVRGRVAKFLSQIMGTNWLHLEDGTGSGATARLRVTTDATATVGDIIVAEGTVVVDKDFGSGYRYDVLIDKAKITKE